jgi:hypothetical protein
VAEETTGVVLAYIGIDELLTGVKYHGDERTSLAIAFDAVTDWDETGLEFESSFLCIPRTKGSGRPSLAGACFSQHLP